MSARRTRPTHPWVAAAGLALVCASFASLGSCDEDETPMCLAPPGSTGTCVDACNRLYEIECLIGKDREDCAALCELAVAPLSDEGRGRVLACYAASSSCEDVDHCGQACGDGDPIVRFGTTDGGVPPVEDMGAPPEEDMGTPPEEDMGPPPEEDMGPPDEPDAG